MIFWLKYFDFSIRIELREFCSIQIFIMTKIGFESVQAELNYTVIINYWPFLMAKLNSIEICLLLGFVNKSTCKEVKLSVSHTVWQVRETRSSIMKPHTDHLLWLQGSEIKRSWSGPVPGFCGRPGILLKVSQPPIHEYGYTETDHLLLISSGLMVSQIIQKENTMWKLGFFKQSNGIIYHQKLIDWSFAFTLYQRAPKSLVHGLMTLMTPATDV